MMWRFAQPIIPLAVTIVIIWWLLRQRNEKQIAPAIRYPDIRVFAGLSSSWKVRFRWIPDALRWVSVGLILVALARPQSGQSRQIIRGQGIQIVLVLDISGSMEATDFGTQNRFEAARAVIDKFIQRREFDRIGLVVFARDAFQLVPPTLDYDVLRDTLSKVQLATAQGVADGTAIGSGLTSAGNMLRSGEAASKVVILLTDGASNAGDIGPLTAAEALAALNMRVYTIGMVPNVSTRFDNSVDEATLKSVATITKGNYYAASNENDLETIYSRIDSLERSDIEKQVQILWQERFQPFIAFSLIFLIIEQLLRQTVLRVFP